jgi:hypothetical protein
VVLVPESMTFGAALEWLAQSPLRQIRRVGWEADMSVLLFDEEGFLTLKKPAGTLHKAFICTEDVINADWVAV